MQVRTPARGSSMPPCDDRAASPRRTGAGVFPIIVSSCGQFGRTPYGAPPLLVHGSVDRKDTQGILSCIRSPAWLNSRSAGGGQREHDTSTGPADPNEGGCRGLPRSGLSGLRARRWPPTAWGGRRRTGSVRLTHRVSVPSLRSSVNRDSGGASIATPCCWHRARGGAWSFDTSSGKGASAFTTWPASFTQLQNDVLRKSP